MAKNAKKTEFKVWEQEKTAHQILPGSNFAGKIIPQKDQKGDLPCKTLSLEFRLFY